MDLNQTQILHFLSHYGYWIMLPLMTIEGPVITIISAMMAKFGTFNVFIVFILSVVGDMLGDVILYWLGYVFGMAFVQKVGKYFGITEKLVLKMEDYFKKHGGKTIFTVKSTTGLCWAAFTAAGIVRMNFRKFLKFSFLGGLVWSFFLVAMGYFYGYMWAQIGKYIKWTGYAVIFLAIATFIAITIYKKKQSHQILEDQA